jgi:hypothetical protein
MLKSLRFLAALFVCTVALLLPYRMRLVWFRAVAAIVHFPFRLFAWTARFIMRRTQTENPYGE